MAKGRKKKADHLKVVAGTDQPCRMSENSPKPINDVPETPVMLSAAAAEKFEKLVAITSRNQTVSASYLDAYKLLAECLAEIDLMNSAITMDGYVSVSPTGVVKAHPLLAQRNTLISKATSLLSEFGLTPASLSRVGAAAPEEQDEFEGF